jgi:hypothetical protein
MMTMMIFSCNAENMKKSESVNFMDQITFISLFTLDNVQGFSHSFENKLLFPLTMDSF